MTVQTPARHYRFGVFELDGARGELRRQGIRIKINAQPLQVLLLLLDRPGEVFTREEITGKLWPEGTFVDFEHGVNSAINRIREALGDAASNPRFVETVARRGYRFIAPVERIGAEEPVPAQLTQEESSPEPDPEVAAPALTILATAEELPHTPYPVVKTLFLLLQLMYLGFYIGALANLAEIEELFAALPRASLVFNLLIFSAAILIPVRIFIVCAALFHPPGVRKKLLQMWPFLLPGDVLWSLAPFLLLHHIHYGLALACTTILVYAPFAHRSLVLMGAGGDGAA